MAEPSQRSEEADHLGAKKQRRPPLSCEQCRKRKVKCDRGEPCNHCAKSPAETCTYAPTYTPKSRRRLASRPAQTARSRGTTLSPQAAGAAHVSARSSTRTSQQETPGGSPATAVGATAEPNHAEFVPPARGSILKGQYLGHSHWMHIAASFTVELSMLKNQAHTHGELFQVLYQCKVICRDVKNIRLPSLSSLDIGKASLPRELCDDFVDAYIDTFEGVFRILHIPTLKKDYESYWRDPLAVSESFVVLMQLCIALGSSVRDRPLSMMTTAAQWIHEAQLWLIKPPEKDKISLTGIQIMCLLSLSKMTCGVSADLTWIMSGSLVRTAMHMGLHRDPSHLDEMSTYRAEMRRRLWATILELNLQYSFEVGGMPLISCDDYDTLPPADIDDYRLDDSIDDVRKRTTSSGIATQMSVPLEVLKSFPVRLKLLRYINDFRTNIDYEKTLELDSELTKACRSFTQTIGALTKDQSIRSASADFRHSSPVTPFHVSLAEVTLYRCFHALHLPILLTAFDDPRFYFSRKMCLDGALKMADLWCFSQPGPRSRRSTSTGSALSEFEQLTVHGAGMFKNIAVQSACIMALELIHDKSGRSSGLGYLPAAGSSDLSACLDRALDWTVNRMRAGELTVKAHCFLSACVAHADALEQGMDKAATVALLVRRTTDAARTSLALLRDVARESGVPVVDAQAQAQQRQESAVIVDDGLETLAAGWDGGWAWDESDDWMWSGAWSQLNVSMPLDAGEQFSDTTDGYPR